MKTGSVPTNARPVATPIGHSCQSSLLTLVGGGDNLLPCHANCALSILGRCIT